MLATLRYRLGSDSGFTLIEMLVAILASGGIVIAVVAVLGLSQRQEVQITNHVQADQSGRIALTKMQEELRSSCVGGMTPIQAPYESTVTAPLEKLNGQNLWFVSAFGTEEAGNAEMKHGFLHDINWKQTSVSGTKLGTLTDYAYEGTGALPAIPWKFTSPFSTASSSYKKRTILATNVIPPEESGTIKLFRYYKYDTTSTDSTYGEPIELKSSELPPASEEAGGKIIEVKIEYTQTPNDADTRSSQTTPVSGTTILRLTPSETTEEGTTTCT
jgi:type II secretory pathway pseudopilin PulG